MLIEFKVPGSPVAQPRVKSTSRGKHSSVYTPTKTSTGRSNGVAEFKAAIRLKAAEYMSGSLFTGPLRVDVEFVFARHKTKIWKSKPMPRYRHIQKPDRDNLDKLVCDALKGVLWVDDCQACSGSLDKWHAAGDESPHVLIRVTEIPEC